jgi:hypothetical protein
VICEVMRELEWKEANALDHIRLICDRVRKGRWIEVFHAVRREQVAHFDECEVCGERKAA